MNCKSKLKENIEDAQTCWKFRNCPKETRNKCEVYTMSWGEECWILAADPIVKGCFSSKRYNNCTNCHWSKRIIE